MTSIYSPKLEVGQWNCQTASGSLRMKSVHLLLLLTTSSYCVLNMASLSKARVSLEVWEAATRKVVHGVTQMTCAVRCSETTVDGRPCNSFIFDKSWNQCILASPPYYEGDYLKEGGQEVWITMTRKNTFPVAGRWVGQVVQLTSPPSGRWVVGVERLVRVLGLLYLLHQEQEQGPHPSCPWALGGGGVGLGASPGETP